ncbi:MAG: ATP-binding protein [Rectinemataceae bacterium]
MIEHAIVAEIEAEQKLVAANRELIEQFKRKIQGTLGRCGGGMMNNIIHDAVQGSLFEEDYLIRTLGTLARSADIALTELVANAWDAGASEVRISIPEEYEDLLVVEDDGTGLTHANFHNRWMKLGYDRLRHQGKKVEFPPGRNGNRLAYGRNGVGRHGLLCFSNEYVVRTKAEGSESIFHISTHNEQYPFIIQSEEQRQGIIGHGTRLEVAVKRNLSKPERVLELLSARFMHDPSFKVLINGKSIPLEEHKGLLDSTEIITSNGVVLKMYFLDTLAAGRKTLYQGIAFWQGGRLVGEPSWILGTESIIDGRTRFAKRYTMVVASNDLADFVNGDWTGFRKDEALDPVFLAVKTYAEEEFAKLSAEQMDTTKDDIHKEFHTEIDMLSALGKYEVDEAIQSIATNHPTVRPEILSIAVEAVINVEKSRSGMDLLRKLSTFSEDDIEGLNRLLSQWTVKDALCVLDEIDRRISTIEAIRKLSEDSKVDELHVLHPLITEARWLFGPEFDSPEFVSNRQLQTVARQLFSRTDGKDIFINPKKRPDLVALENCSIGLTGVDSFDNEKELVVMKNILLVELKRGGFELTRAERNQLQNYLEDLRSSGVVGGSPYIHAYLVGMKVEKGGLSGSRVMDPNDDKREIGRITITSFSQLVDTAEQRLFRLRATLKDRYDDIPGMELFARTQGELGI